MQYDHVVSLDSKRRRTMRVMAVVAVMAYVIALAAPGSPAADAQQPQPWRCPIELSDEWVLAYYDDFSGQALSPTWRATAGAASVKDGQLVLSTEKEQAEVVLEKPRFESPGLRMEFDAHVPQGTKASDLSVFINSDWSPEGKTGGCEGSYLFQFGGMLNTRNQLRRTGEIVDATVTTQPLIQPGVIYHVTVENDCGLVRMDVDGTTLLKWDDQKPLWGRDQSAIGFYTWESTIVIDNLKVYHRVPK